ncbi:hypothetical protein ACLOJK_001444 [Asimina triloba]
MSLWAFLEIIKIFSEQMQITMLFSEENQLPTSVVSNPAKTRNAAKLDLKSWPELGFPSSSLAQADILGTPPKTKDQHNRDVPLFGLECGKEAASLPTHKEKGAKERKSKREGGKDHVQRRRESDSPLPRKSAFTPKKLNHEEFYRTLTTFVREFRPSRRWNPRHMPRGTHHCENLVAANACGTEGNWAMKCCRFPAAQQPIDEVCHRRMADK